MEIIYFSCVKCNFQMTAETIYCGQIVSCPQCGMELEIPLKQENMGNHSESPSPHSDYNQNNTRNRPSPLQQPTDNIKTQQVPAPPSPLNWVDKINLSARIFWGAIILILLLFVVLKNTTSRGPFEYKIEYFSPHYSHDFTKKIKELDKEGYEYVGPLTNGNILFRKKK